MLEGVQGDLPLARLRVVVGGMPLALLVGAVVRLAKAGLGDLLRGESPGRSTCASSMFHVCVSSMGTAQRITTGRLAAFSRVASSISRVNWWTLGAMKSATRTHTSSLMRRVAIYIIPYGVSSQSSSARAPKASVN